LKRRSNTKGQHSPHSYFLDEGLSSHDIAALMKDAGMSVFQYELLFERHKKISDDEVIARTKASGLILATKDEAMEREWIGSIIAARARMILLTDGTGGIANLAAALICAHDRIQKILLDNPEGPLIIKVNRHGDVSRIRGEAELKERYRRLFQAALVRSKKLGTPPPKIIKVSGRGKESGSASLPFSEPAEEKP
jgi:hypothetical protein